MPPSVPTRRLVQFGVFEVDFESGELHKRGMKVRLQDQPFKVLQVLLERPGQVVTKEELRVRVWPENTFVEFDQGLYSAMARLRDALGDNSESPCFIETVARRGYRFIAPLTPAAVPPPVPESVSETPLAVAPHTGRRLSLSLFVGLLGGAVPLVLILTFNIAGVREWLYSRSHPVRSIAVLPLENLSGDVEQEYFADGMTDELTTELAQIGSVRVTSRGSSMRYKNTKTAPPKIARELGVEAVLEGSVLRVADRVRISAQLIQAEGDRHLWAKSYERDVRDVLSLQSEIARDIARQVRATIRGHETGRPVNPEAYEAYLRGLAYSKQKDEQSWRTSVDYFNRAIQTDPQWAPAYAQLARIYNYMASTGHPELYPKSKAVSLKALRLDDGLAVPHWVLAFTLHNYDWDWSGAEREYRRALELDPNDSEAHHGYAMLLVDRKSTRLNSSHRL